MSPSTSDIFRAEAGELLAQLEAALLELEDCPDSREAIDQAFRTIHTLKGSGAVAGYDTVTEVAHELESSFDLVRSGQLTVTPDLISLTLWVADMIKALVAGEEFNGDDEVRRVRAMAATLRQLGGQIVKNDADEASAHLPLANEGAKETFIHLLRFRPHAEIFTRGINPLSFIPSLGELGHPLAVAHLVSLPVLDKLDPEESYTFWDIALIGAIDGNALRDHFIFIEDNCQLEVATIATIPDPESCDLEALRQILESSGTLDFAELRQRCEAQFAPQPKSLPKEALANVVAAEASVESAKDEEKGSYIRVRADRLDALVNLVGEMVTLQGRLAAAALRLKDPTLVGIGEEADRLTLSLRRQVLKTRMVPIGATFARYKRMVRDFGQEVGKEIDLVIAGAKTEVDKTMIDQLQDPLVHLIRNCIDHGIESPEQRLAVGKPAKGSLFFAASQSGAHIVIEIGDDGSGLDLDKIRAKAVAQGIIDATAELSEQENANLIFSAGLSTAAQISKVSGRGVGMDAVKHAVEALNGTIEIETKAGLGTTFVIKLPLTLAIADGLLVQVGRGRYVLPLSDIKECIELRRDDEAHAHGRNLIMVRGVIIPYLRLREQFAIAGQPPLIEQIVIAQTRSECFGLVVDRVIGGHQTVIKSLGQLCNNAPGVSGATILGDGQVALTLDLVQLRNIALSRERATVGERN